MTVKWSADIQLDTRLTYFLLENIIIEIDFKMVIMS